MKSLDIFFHLSVLIPQVVTATFDSFEYYTHTYTQKQKFDFLQDDSSEHQSHVSIFLLSTFIWMSNLHLNMNIYKGLSWLLLPFNQIYAFSSMFHLLVAQTKNFRDILDSFLNIFQATHLALPSK